MSNGLEIPVEFEGKYLLGPEGAHLNIAGISGLATKTTYAMFLMNSIQQRLDDKVTMIVFNVKGTDLLAIDEPSNRGTDSTAGGRMEEVRVEPDAFQECHLPLSIQESGRARVLAVLYRHRAASLPAIAGAGMELLL